MKIRTVNAVLSVEGFWTLLGVSGWANPIVENDIFVIFCSHTCTVHFLIITFFWFRKTSKRNVYVETQNPKVLNYFSYRVSKEKILLNTVLFTPLEQSNDTERSRVATDVSSFRRSLGTVWLWIHH